MGQAFTPGLLAKSSVSIRRSRDLPVEGEILKNVGESVQGTDIVARALLPGDLTILRVAEGLGIEPFEVKKGLKVQEAAEVKEGDLICEHAGLFGLFKSQFKAPSSGTIDFISEHTGHVGLRVSPREIRVDGYLSGRVVAIDPKKSVTIEAKGALVQGIFGIGGERQGKLLLLPIAPSTIPEIHNIPADVRGSILVGGTKPSIEFIREAENRGVLGLVVGAIDDHALAEYLGFDLGVAITGDEKVKMTIIITEGFGKLAISDRVLTVLKPLEGKLASINGATQVRAGAVRPEIVICNSDSAEREHNEVYPSLALGSRIRIIRVPYFGAFGTVTALPSELTKIATGAETRVLKATLENGEEVTVPRANVELA